MTWPDLDEALKLTAAKLVKAIKAGDLDAHLARAIKIEADAANPRSTVLDALSDRVAASWDEIQAGPDPLPGVFARALLAFPRCAVAVEGGKLIRITRPDRCAQLVIEAGPHGPLISTFTLAPFALGGQGRPSWRRVVERHPGAPGEFAGDGWQDRVCAAAVFLFGRLG